MNGFRKIHRYKVSYLLLLFLILSGACVVYFSFTREDAPTLSTVPSLPTAQSNNQTIPENHVLCVLVPYRDRFEELQEFVPHLSKFLNRQSIKYHIIVVNHISDGYRFNRGSSFNAGFHIMREKFPECDYIALHDVDLLPLANGISYAYPGNDAFHAIPPGTHPVPLYSHRDYVGGILLVSSEVYSRMNGFANYYWGWGYEDIDFRRRMEKHSVQLTRPENLPRDRKNTFKNIHGAHKQRDSFWCPNQVAAFHDQDLTFRTGLSDVNFTIASETYLSIAGFPCYVFNINIKCIFEETPWCRPFCINSETPVSTTIPKSFWNMDGEVVWDRLQALAPENWNKNPILNLGMSANSNLLNRLFNRNQNTNSGMSANSLPWDRLLSQAQAPPWKNK